MISGTNSSNKQFIAVILFIVFIVLSIIGISKFDSSNDPKKEDSKSNSNMIIDSNAPTVKESKSVVVVTSNNNSSNTTSNNSSNKTSNKTSNTTSNKTSNGNSNEIPVSYFITELSANKIYVAGTAKIKVDIYPVNATNKNVKYKSTNTNIAKVGSDGTVVGISEGVCYIDIEVEGGGSARVQIQVYNRESSNVTPTSNKPSNSNSNKPSNSNSNTNTTVDVIAVGLNYSDYTLSVNNSFQLSTTIYPSNATNKKITWLSSSPSVASVSNGKVTALKEGTTIITAKSNNGKYATCKVTVTKPYTPPTEVAVSSLTPTYSTSFSLNQGITRTIGVTISPSNATNKTISWYSSNTGVVSVSGNGTSGNTSTATVKAISAGTATITAKASNGVSTTYKVTVNKKNGWYTENGERVYYDNGTKLPKYGNFDYTLYGTTAWISSYSSGTRYLNFMKKPADSGDKWGSLSSGTKVTIVGGTYNTDGSYISNGTGKYIKIKYNGNVGYVLTNYVMVNLPDLMPSMKYDIGAASPNGTNFTSGGYSIPGVTGVKLYKFSKASNSKIGRSEYYAPLLYPAARYLQKALNNARSQGYNFVIYDTYRPTPVEEADYNAYMKLYNSNATVRAAVNRNGYNLSWFMTSGYSKHSAGIAIDMGLTNSSGTVLAAQTGYGVLDESAAIEHNNANSKKLRDIMLSVKDSSVMRNSNSSGCTAYHSANDVFYSLKSEWWHYDLRCTIYDKTFYESFYPTN